MDMSKTPQNKAAIYVRIEERLRWIREARETIAKAEGELVQLITMVRELDQ
jgi:hypothetical protein